MATRCPNVKSWLDEMKFSGEFTGKAGEIAVLHQPSGLKAKRWYWLAEESAINLMPAALAKNRRIGGACR